MTKIAVRMLRNRLGSALATLIALAAGVMILVSMGALVESGLRYRPQPQRYAGADIVIAHRDLTITGKDLDGEPVTTTVALPEGTVPAALTDQISRVPGVAAAIADSSIPVQPPARPAVPAVGHGWGSAALGPYRIVAGAAPATDGEVALDARLATTVGDALDLVVGGTTRRFRIAGIVQADGPPAVFFTDRVAAALNPHAGRADAIGVIAAPGADRAALTAALEKLATEAGAKAYAGADRGWAERSDTAAGRDLLIEVGASFGGYVVLLIAFVVAGTVGLSVRHRRRDLALLRAIAATPGQVRRMIVAESAVVSLVGASLGVPAGLLATRWLRGELVTRGFIPAALPMAAGVLATLAAVVATTLVAVVSALIAARRATAIRPTEALGEVAVEPARGGKVRLGFGLAALAAAVSSSSVTVGATGPAALVGALGMLYLFVLAVGLLAPWINRSAARLLAPVLRTAWGASGYLASANLRANARGMATVLTALVLAVGFGGSVWFLQDNLARQTLAQSRDGTLAERVLVAPAGLPVAAVDELRRIPGVRAATPVRGTSVVVKVFDGAESVAAQAIDPDGADATINLRVSAGRLADLRGESVAVSRVRAEAQGWKLGQRVPLWLADGTPVTLRVVAIYERGLGFGDVVLNRTLTGGEVADRILVRAAPDAQLDEVAARYPTSSLVDARSLSGALATDLALSAWLNRLLIGVMVGYAALAAANTMVIAALARRRELALLRLVGVTRRQVKRMVHAEQAGLLGVAVVIGGAIAALTLTAVVNALTGDPVPYVPPLGLAAVLGGVTLLALTTTVLPIGQLLRTPPIEHIGLKE